MMSISIGWMTWASPSPFQWRTNGPERTGMGIWSMVRDKIIHGLKHCYLKIHDANELMVFCATALRSKICR